MQYSRFFIVQIPSILSARLGEFQRAIRRIGMLWLVLAIYLCFPATRSFAVGITWGAVANITGDADVNTNGTRLYAYGGTNTATTINGVPFTAVTSGSTWGSVSFTGFGGFNSVFGATASPFSGLTTNYQYALLTSAWGSGTAGSVTLNGLTPGRAYSVQIWVNDSRGGYQSRYESVTSAGGNTNTLHFAPNSNNAGAVGQYVVGTFTANASSQAFSVNGNSVVQINAISVRDNGFVNIPSVNTSTRFNLAKYRPVATDSANGSQSGSYLTDGLVNNSDYWQSGPSSPHWAQVIFPFPVTVGSAQLALGLNNASAPTIFNIQYLTNSSWVTVPGSAVANNTNTERNIVFTGPITASSFRFYDALDGTVYIREMALYPPNGTNGFPFGTDFSIDVARKQPAVTTTNTFGNWPLLAADGRVNADSAWETTLAGSNSLLINLQFTNKIGSAHLYSGATGVGPLTNFVLQYWSGGAWANIPGGSVTGNTNGALVIPFTTPVTTTEVQLLFTNTGTSAVQELCVFPANQNGGYPLGTGVITNAPVPAKYDTYSDSYYYLSNSATAQVIVESNGVPVPGTVPAYTWASRLADWPGQYQVLLNYDNGTYRLINRLSGLCLAGAQMTTNVGAGLVDEPYSALPDQEWFLQAVDGVNFYLVNQFSGLAMDAQNGALVQNALTNSPSQLWQISLAQIFPKKGWAGGTANTFTNFGASWNYQFGLGTVQVPTKVVGYPTFEQPQPWYALGNTVAGNFWGLYPGWRTNGASLMVMGYVEPDNPSAYFDPVRCAVDWLNVQNLDLPLTGPGPAYLSVNSNLTNTYWLPTWLNIVTNWGCRVEYLPAHEYVSSDGGSSACWINPIQDGYNTYGIPMWMDEGGIVDWSGTGTWSEDDNYTEEAEFVWRAEQTSWLRKFTYLQWGEGDITNHPANPWTGYKPGVSSYTYDYNGNLTPWGELYAAWDDDANVETNKSYSIFNSGTRKRMQNTQTPLADATNIRNDGPSVEWTLQPVSGSAYYYIVSALDGRVLTYTNGGSLNLSAAGTTGTAAQWSLALYQYGWYYLQHPATGKEVSLSYDNTNSIASYSMVPNTTTGTAVEWRFIVPLPPSVWTGANNSAWGISNNWNRGTANPLGPVVEFDRLSTSHLATVLDTNFNYSLSAITVTTPSGPVSIGGSNTLTLGGGGINLNQATQPLTINAPVLLSVLGENPVWSVTNNQTLSVNGGVSGYPGLTIAGGGTVQLGGSNTYAGNTAVNGGTLNLTGSYNPSVPGYTNIFTVNGGALNFDLGSGSANFYGDGYSYSPQISDSGSAGTLTLQSGTLSINTMPNAGTGNYAGLLLGCNSTTANGTLVVNGGNLNVPGRILMAANGAGSRGTLTLNGGNVTLGTVGSSGSYTAVNGQGLIWFGGSTSTVNLYGGTLALWSLYDPTAGSSVTVKLSGGTLQAIYNNPTFTEVTGGSLTLKVSTNGATVDPAGYAITIPNALTHDGGLSGADGGLTVNDSVGGGTLTLSAANSYTGPTIINAGTLALSGSGSLASPTITVAGGATFAAPAGGWTLGSSQTLGNTGSGTANLVGPVSSGAGTMSLSYVSGTPSFNVTGGTLTLSASTVLVVNNLGTTLAPGTYLIIGKSGSGAVAGTAPTSVSVLNSSGVGAPTASIVGGQLYVTLGGGLGSSITYTGVGPFTYNGAAQTPSVSFSGSTGARTYSYVGLSPAYGPSVSAPTNAGSYYLSNTVASDGTYAGAANAQNFSIARAAAAVVVTPYTVTYDGNPHTATVTSITGVNGETNAAVGTVLLNTTHIAIGTYTGDSWSFTGTANYNNLGAQSITDTIAGPAPVFTGLNSLTNGYGSTNLTLTGTLSAAGPVYPASGETVSAMINGLAVSGTVTDGTGDFSIVDNDPTLATNAVAGSPYTLSITYNYGGDTNLGVASTNLNPTLVITNALLSITANDDSKTYDGNVYLTNNGVTYSGFVNGETAGVLGGTLAYGGTSQGALAAGSYMIVPSGLTSTNYLINYVTGTLTVNQAATAVGVASAENPSGYQDAVAFVATLPGDATGAVVFSFANVPFSTNPVTGAVTTSVGLTNLPPGTNLITVAYLGDGNYVGSTNVLNQIVTNLPPQVVSFAVGAVIGTPVRVSIIDGRHAVSPYGDPLTVVNVSGETDGFASFTTTNLTYTATNGTLDNLTYVVSDPYGTTSSGQITVNIISNGPGYNELSVTKLMGGNQVVLSYLGTPDDNYALDSTPTLAPPVLWTAQMTNLTATNGNLTFTNTVALPSSFYRTRLVP